MSDILDEFEESLAEMDQTQIDEFSKEAMNYDEFIVLSKKDLTNFCRVVEPLTKASVDEYGKSAYICPIDKDTVELRYTNTPYVVCHKVANKSNKLMKPFAVSVSTLKKLVTNAFASLVFVQSENEVSIAVCGSLLYVETKPLSEQFYQIERLKADKTLDKEKAAFVFRKAGSVLSLSDRASEKVIVVHNGYANFNTGFFVAKVGTPFAEDAEFVIWQMVANILAIFADISKVGINYDVVEGEEADKLVVSCDGQFYCELPVGKREKVEEFYSPVVDQLLNFDADIRVVNDSIIHLIGLVKSVDYLSDIVTISFEKSMMKFVIYDTAMTKPSVYEFPIIEGSPKVLGEMKLNADVLKTFLEITSLDVKYCYNQDGLGINNELGQFLIRKNQ